jgi:hypothetical protein
MVFGELSFLVLITNLVLLLLWSALGCIALLWLVVVAGLLRSGAALILPLDKRSERLSGADIRFLRRLHILP